MIKRRWLPALLACLSLGLAGLTWAAGPAAKPAWADLTPTQRQALAPLERDWGSIDAPRRAKWLEVATRFPTMPADERQRLQARMADWARLTPAERSSARMQFQEARSVPANERQARWQAYQALPEADRQALAASAKKPAKAASASVAPLQTAKLTDDATGKRNLVQPAATPRARAVTPTVQQARPGATTTTMTTRPLPPAHNQAGLPKIAATSGFVNPATLLPQRGPQGAAVRSAAAASEPEAQP